MKCVVPTSVCLAVLLLGGCSESPPLGQVQGTVRIEGQPVAGLELEFQPAGKGPPSYAVTDHAGRFEAKFDRRRHGAVLGRHSVRINVDSQATDADGHPFPIAKHLYRDDPEKLAFPLEVAPGRNTLHLSFSLKNGELIAAEDSSAVELR